MRRGWSRLEYPSSDRKRLKIYGVIIPVNEKRGKAKRPANGSTTEPPARSKEGAHIRPDLQEDCSGVT